MKEEPLLFKEFYVRNKMTGQHSGELFQWKMTKSVTFSPAIIKAMFIFNFLACINLQWINVNEVLYKPIYRTTTDFSVIS